MSQELTVWVDFAESECPPTAKTRTASATPTKPTALIRSRTFVGTSRSGRGDIGPRPLPRRETE